MSEFSVNTDMFGTYVKIPCGYFYDQNKTKFIYKVINRHQSNTWCEVPLTYQTESNPVTHNKMEDVLNVIQCGIDERKVLTVALKDCEIVENRQHALEKHSARMEMNSFLNMNVAEATKLCVDVFQKGRNNEIQAGDTVYVITNASVVTGHEEEVTFELENVFETRDDAEKTIEIKFAKGCYI